MQKPRQVFPNAVFAYYEAGCIVKSSFRIGHNGKAAGLHFDGTSQKHGAHLLFGPVDAHGSHGGFGAALSVLPVLFFCLWLVVFYKENAANPILWSYGMEILAIAMCLLAVFRLSAYLFYRAKPRRAIFACMLALITSLATLTDSVSLGARAVLGGWGIGTAVMCWIIINNFVPPAPEEDTY